MSAAFVAAAASEFGIMVGTVTEESWLPTMRGTRALAAELGMPPDVRAFCTELLS